jgi:peptidoglycan/LPS O-acetylase OafA/YrhL
VPSVPWILNSLGSSHPLKPADRSADHQMSVQAAGGTSPLYSLPQYRSDIDGLRALAVLPVLGFHAFPRWVSGGFIGVDIFFVISGFLISSIIFSAQEAGRFSYAEFYARRIRRIFPAMLLVLTVTFLMGWFLLLPDEYRLLGRHLLAGSAFVSNLVLWRESGYFEAAAETKPLLHFWSLAVEEQFYLVWPALLGFVWGRKWNPLPAIVAIAAASFAHSLQAGTDDPTLAFYSPLSRFWELLSGGTLAYLARRRPQALRAPVTLQSLFGLALLVMALALIHRDRPFPGWWALLPVAGTVLLISAGPDAWVNRHILSMRPLVWIGLISYPLYLWHWPLLTILSLTKLEPTNLEKAAVLCLAFILAGLTFVAIEKPIRKGSSWVGRLLLMNLVIFAIGGVTYLGGGFSFRLGPARQAVADYFENSRPRRAYFERNQIAERYRFDCDFHERNTISETCYLPEPGRSIVLIWGDSTAQSFRHGLSQTLPATWQILQVASSGCFPRSNPATGAGYCDRSNRLALETVAKVNPDVVLVSQRSMFETQTVTTITRDLTGLGAKRVLFAGQTPQWRQNLYKIILRDGEPLGSTARRRLRGLDVDFDGNRRLKDSLRFGTRAEFVDLLSFFCDREGCLTQVGDEITSGLTTFDSFHLSPAASSMLARDLLAPLIIGGTGVSGARKP